MIRVVYLIHLKLTAVCARNQKKSNKFCDYFSEVGRKYTANIPPALKYFKEHLCHIKHNWSCTGHDDFFSKLIKHLAPSMSYPISIIINISVANRHSHVEI